MTGQGARAPSAGAGLSLLQRVAAGEAAAVPQLLERYGSLVWSVVLRQLGPEAAEDVVQEVFIQLWKNAHRFDPARASEATFITTIARRRVIDHRRRIGVRPEAAELAEEPPSTEEAQEGVEKVEKVEEARLAAEALSQLKPDQRRVLRLAIVEGLTHAQIAEVTRLPLGTVKSHARRGLERVRTLLQKDKGGAS